MRKIYSILALFSTILLAGCEENNLKPLVNDGTPPGKVEITKVTPLPGGLELEYTLPSDNDLLYVKAEYDLVNEIKGVVKVSYFEKKLRVMGFGNTDEKSVRISAVDRGENESEAVEIKASPLRPPVLRIQDSLKITSDFGGARFTWVNRAEAPVAVEIFTEDSITHKLVKVNTVYTSQINGKFSLRNMKSVPTKFAAVVRDRWDNVSDTIRPASGLLTPLLESKLDKKKMKKIVLPSDTRWDAWGFKYEGLIDDDFTTSGHTQGDHPWPQIFTVDFGVKAKLSRFRVYQRSANEQYFFYTHGNPKRYDVYGAATLPADPDDLTQWTKLRPECVSTKPSGPGSQVTDEDLQHALSGDEYDFDQTAVPAEIRYFRFVVWETWDGAGYIDFAELSWWGSIN